MPYSTLDISDPFLICSTLYQYSVYTGQGKDISCKVLLCETACSHGCCINLGILCVFTDMSCSINSRRSLVMHRRICICMCSFFCAFGRVFFIRTINFHSLLVSPWNRLDHGVKETFLFFSSFTVGCNLCHYQENQLAWRKRKDLDGGALI